MVWLSNMRTPLVEIGRQLSEGATRGDPFRQVRAVPTEAHLPGVAVSTSGAANGSRVADRSGSQSRDRGKIRSEHASEVARYWGVRIASGSPPVLALITSRSTVYLAEQGGARSPELEKRPVQRVRPARNDGRMRGWNRNESRSSV